MFHIFSKDDMTRLFTSLFMMAMGTLGAVAQIPEGYYSTLAGKKKAELKTAAYDIISTASVLDYGSGTGCTWYGFYTTDRRSDNSVIDRYSDDTRYFTTQGSSISGMNIEHSFPKSWWGGSKNQAYRDLFNLMPCESSINSSKANYPMGVVSTAKVDNGCTKVGSGTEGFMVWEPADKWKGDFARGYMYMATAYQNLSWSGTQALQILENDTWPTLQRWAYTLYMEWADQDPVDDTEVSRNNAVYIIQGNRNPYVDFPNLKDYVWGDSVDYAFYPELTVRSSAYTSGGGSATTEETIYSADYTSTEGDCTTETDGGSLGFDVWQQTSSYGWKGTAYYKGTRYAADASLVTPEIDLTDYADIKLSFSHAVNYCESPSTTLAVEVRCEGQTDVLSGFTWGTGTSWTFKQSGDISLDAYAGKTIQIAFHYKSTTAEASTWEVKNVEVSGIKHTTGVEQAPVEPRYADAPIVVYSLDGRRLDAMPDHGIVIVRQGNKVWKIAR